MASAMVSTTLVSTTGVGQLVVEPLATSAARDGTVIAMDLPDLVKHLAQKCFVARDDVSRGAWPDDLCGDHRRPHDPRERLRQVVAEARFADELGLDVYGVGEHHRPDMVASAPEIVLATIAGATERIRLSSAVTVLSSADPVRVFQSFVTLDLVSGGRAELMAGRGSFTESFPLFGYSLSDYDALFAEKLDLLLALREDGPVTWSGRVPRATRGRSGASRGPRGGRCRSGSRWAARRTR